MGDRALRHVYALSVAAVLLVGLIGCRSDLGSIARREGVMSDALVRLSDEYAVAARVSDGRVEVVAFTASAAGAWSARISATGAVGPMTAHLVSMGGETGEAWNSLFFGTAPGQGSRVVVEGLDGQGGQVTDGAWVIAFRQRDLRPPLLRWSLFDATGAVLESGTGITP